MMENFLTANWEQLIMANYTVPPKVLKDYLPNGVELDLYNGNAIVSLVGFMFTNTRLFGMPVPGFGTFEEINLRFYVVRKTAGEIRRGVVFINETVPYKSVAWLANILYKEHYVSIPTKHHWNISDRNKEIEYQWETGGRWHSLSVLAHPEFLEMGIGSFEEFIFEHYWGYTRVNEKQTIEYAVMHPRWQVNQINEFNIDCDFAQYGGEFKCLNHQAPSSVMLAGGSAVSVKWKRNKI